MSSTPEVDRVLSAAARLQELVPDAVLVGEDQAVVDLSSRFADILATLEASDGWVTERVRSGRVILGNYGGVETGVLQLRRRRPLEVTEVEVLGHRLRVPTNEEMLRVNAWMVVYRNATRDFLDVAALADRVGLPAAGRILAEMDSYYEDQRGGGRGVTTQLVRSLADPHPYDLDQVDLAAYRQLIPRWRNWDTVQDTCAQLATEVLVAVVDERDT